MYFFYIYLFFIFSPESAERTSFGVQEGDIILVGTDGLFDNMHEEMILQQLAKLKVRHLFSRTSNTKTTGHSIFDKHNRERVDKKNLTPNSSVCLLIFTYVQKTILANDPYMLTSNLYLVTLEGKCTIRMS